MISYLIDILTNPNNIATFQQLCYQIIMTIREKIFLNKYHEINNSNVIIQTLSKDIITSIPASDFLYKGEDFLKNINHKNTIKQTTNFINSIICYHKNKNINNNDDIIIIMQDNNIHHMNTLIGNHGEITTFKYKINNINTLDVKKFNSQEKINGRYGGDNQSTKENIISYKVENKIFHNNLTLLDIDIERIIAETLLHSHINKEKELSKIIDLIETTDPLNIKTKISQPIYTYKIKQLLVAFALGMTPSNIWYGHYANCFFSINKDSILSFYTSLNIHSFGEYLFHNTQIETPSTSRHEFGNIYQENGETFLKLNLQIRFK